MGADATTSDRDHVLLYFISLLPSLCHLPRQCLSLPSGIPIVLYSLCLLHTCVTVCGGMTVVTVHSMAYTDHDLPTAC